MNSYVFSDEGATYTRISKAKARKLWGKELIALCPAKLRPGFPWAPHMIVDPVHIQEHLASEWDFDRDTASFDSYVRNFEWYNCTDNETGYYTAFYLVEEKS